MKSKVIDSSKTMHEFNGKQVPQYTVTSVDKYGTFTSSVRLHEEDAEFANDIVGYDFALRKNDIKSRGVKLKYTEQRLIQAEHEYTTALAKFGPNSEVTKFVEHQRNIIKRDYDLMHEQYVYMRDGFKAYTDRYIKKRADSISKLNK